ncbi:lccl domain containing protein [Grosmannia clavigera kw1407]|uniref:Lccl domain containing protein n=1 Tax=Grosmannia clavigera (strain kw1407 / UAMH 11150) TaxID=655863 RepID=F0XM98_GROCL|nr:lccl domain containing protein [Grosmannia clavigera kw1407]EFX01452.1 lccl domain containing protein [Grosmannia clavigera kw1407]
MMDDNEQDDVKVATSRSGSSSEVTIGVADVASGPSSSGSLVSDHDEHLDEADAPLLGQADDDMTNSDGEGPPTPRFLQETGTWKHWRWLPYPARRLAVAAARWSRGPPDAHAHVIKPLLPAVQLAPLQLRDRLLAAAAAAVGGGPRWLWRRAAFFGWLWLWLVTFAVVLRRGLRAGEIAGWGTPADIGCGNTYWVPGNQCGLDGSDCRPFSGSGFPFRCPSSCAGYAVLNPRAVGDQEVVYRTLVVGGPGSGPHGNATIYRGDSFLCSAAIHAGVVSDARGGCGVVRLVGRQSAFAASTHHEIDSVAFDSHFPLAFEFLDGIDCPAHDPRWPLLTVSVVFSVVLSLMVASPAAFFWPVFTGIFWTVGLATDPPPAESTASLVSIVLGAFLPAALAGWVIYDKLGVRRTLGRGFAAHIEKTVLWLGACWVGALTNYTFDYIPIARLTPHDLQQQPGAKAALATIITILLVIVASQIWFFRQEGRLRPYLKLYILFVSSLCFCAAIPHLNLRIHHYILALLLLPGTSMQTRPALAYQGLLVGLFINGTCRWGWASLLQTPAALQGDAQLGSPLPELLPPVVRLASAAATAAATAATAAVAAAANTSSITFFWRPPPGPRYDGISVLVNDVERHRAFFEPDGRDPDSGDEVSSGARSFVWQRPVDAAADEYFRFAYLEGRNSDDYTKAGTWTAAGDWIPMAPGPSRVRSRSLDGETTQWLR